MMFVLKQPLSKTYLMSDREKQNLTMDSTRKQIMLSEENLERSKSSQGSDCHSSSMPLTWHCKGLRYWWWLREQSWWTAIRPHSQPYSIPLLDFWLGFFLRTRCWRSFLSRFSVSSLFPKCNGLRDKHEDLRHWEIQALFFGEQRKSKKALPQRPHP